MKWLRLTWQVFVQQSGSSAVHVPAVQAAPGNQTLLAAADQRSKEENRKEEA